MDEHTAPIGIPSYMGMSSRASGAASAAGLFFVSVHETMLIESGGSSRVGACSCTPQCPQLAQHAFRHFWWHAAYLMALA